MALAQRQAVANVSSAASEEPPLITAAQDSTTAHPSTTTASQPQITIIAMGGTIDKDYPRSAGGYAFEIDEPAAGRVLSDLPPNVSVPHVIVSVCRKDSTEINAADRQALCDAVASVPPGGRVVVTHGTDTLVDGVPDGDGSGVFTNVSGEGVTGSSSYSGSFTGPDGNGEGNLSGAKIVIIPGGDDCGGTCPGDFDGNGIVDGADFGFMIAAWGPCKCPEDLNGDGQVDGADVGLFVALWGACP